MNKRFLILLWCCWCLGWVCQCYWPLLRVSRGRAGRWHPLRHSCISCRTACLQIPLSHAYTQLLVGTSLLLLLILQQTPLNKQKQLSPPPWASEMDAVKYVSFVSSGVKLSFHSLITQQTLQKESKRFFHARSITESVKEESGITYCWWIVLGATPSSMSTGSWWCV